MNGMLQDIGSLFFMPEHNYLDIFLRLTYAAVIGALIGVERSSGKHDAGLRTHMLVCLGAATIMTLSETMHLQYGGDIGRFGSQVVSGIGFLGAGCIMVKGNHVNGLTTAAGLWTTACIGLTIGMGYFFISTVTAALLLIATKLLRPVSFRIRDKGSICHYTLQIRIRNHSNFSVISNYILEHEFHMDSVEMETYNVYILKITTFEEYSIDKLICALMENPEILEVKLLS